MAVHHAALSFLDCAIKRWLCDKYEACGTDDEARVIYEVHPEDWENGDLDFVHRWVNFFHAELKPKTEMHALVNEARTRGVNTVAVDRMYPPEVEPDKYAAAKKVAVGVAGAGFLYWLFKPSEFKEPEGLPDVDVKPAADVLRRMGTL